MVSMLYKATERYLEALSCSDVGEKASEFCNKLVALYTYVPPLLILFNVVETGGKQWVNNWWVTPDSMG